MRKIFLAGFILIIFSSTSFGQKDSDNILISVNGGTGIPEGNFKYEKYAYSGTALSMSATLTSQENHFELSALIDYNSNNFDLNGFLNSPDKGMASNGGLAISNGNYDEVWGLLGFSRSFPLVKRKVSLNFMFLFGISYAIYPHMDYYSIPNSIYGPNQQVTEVNINPVGAFAIPLGVGVNERISIYKEFFLVLGVNYLTTYASWKNVDQTSISLLNLTAGLGYKF
jgi:hypothetical protein